MQPASLVLQYDQGLKNRQQLKSSAFILSSGDTADDWIRQGLRLGNSERWLDRNELSCSAVAASHDDNERF